MTAIRVMVADDHSLVRAGLRALLQTLDGVEVVAEASHGRQALSLVTTLQPDVVLMDISMPELNGLEATAQIASESPNSRVIVLSMHTNEEYVLRALRAGAAGYLIKDAGTAELETAVRAVARGDTYLSPAVSKHMVAEYLRRVGGQDSPHELLTLRQREVLQLLAEGHSTHNIAQKLNISVKTVEAHRAQIVKRLDIHDLAGLVRYAIRTGLVNSD
jgi:DNA-binding NarL/FixJ family response regulator